MANRNKNSPSVSSLCATYVFLLFWSPQRVLAIEVLEKSGRRGNRGCRVALRYFASSFQRLLFLRVVLLPFPPCCYFLILFLYKGFRSKCGPNLQCYPIIRSHEWHCERKVRGLMHLPKWHFGGCDDRAGE
jgi:hypothetical protein